MQGNLDYTFFSGNLDGMFNIEYFFALIFSTGQAENNNNVKYSKFDIQDSS